MPDFVSKLPLIGKKCADSHIISKFHANRPLESIPDKIKSSGFLDHFGTDGPTAPRVSGKCPTRPPSIIM